MKKLIDVTATIGPNNVLVLTKRLEEAYTRIAELEKTTDRIEFIRDVTGDTRACPFCGSGEVDERSLMAWLMGPIKVHYVKCEECAARGPMSVTWKDEKSAIENWNEYDGQA